MYLNISETSTKSLTNTPKKFRVGTKYRVSQVSGNKPPTFLTPYSIIHVCKVKVTKQHHWLLFCPHHVRSSINISYNASSIQVDPELSDRQCLCWHGLAMKALRAEFLTSLFTIKICINQQKKDKMMCFQWLPRSLTHRFYL